MLSRSDRPLGAVSARFAEFGVEVGFFVPTETGLAKSIIDAHASLRRFLKRMAIHDFDQQLKGSDHRVLIDAVLVDANGHDERTVSLYRPETKGGDPRLWVSRLGSAARPGNLIAVFVGADARLHVVNTSDPVVWSSIDDPGSYLRRSFPRQDASQSATELLEMLREICRQGFVESRREGPTGVGYTLESLLGIKANSSKAPDFKGIEIKSGRLGSGGKQETRTTLFSKTPDWQASALDAKGLLREFGYEDTSTGRRQLYCSVKNVPNTLGLALRVSDDTDYLNLSGGAFETALVWPLEALEGSLRKKHRETFWVKADVRKQAGTEWFRYRIVEHTRKPLIGNLSLLLADGTVEMDLTLSIKESGRTRDHGYLFKLWPHDQPKLFPSATVHDLGASRDR